MVYKNREEAALLLAEKLQQYKHSNALVLALPRGGVPLGYQIAKQLGLPLDIILIKKIGYPGHPELAVGAVSLQGRLLNQGMSLSQDYFDAETEKIRGQLKQRYKLFRGNKPPAEVKNKTVLLVDDGIATGYTIKTAAQLLAELGAARIVLVAPVAPASKIEELQKWADEVVVLSAPEQFMAVGQFYHDFSEVSDQEVADLLARAG